MTEPSRRPPAPRVLVVEDHRDSREALSLILARMGFAVESAATLADAQRLLAGHQVVLLDLMLPDGDGSELLREIRQSGAPTRVAVITASTEAYSQSQLGELGPDIVFRKPVDLMAILRWLRGPA